MERNKQSKFQEEVAIVASLKDCGKLKDIQRGRQLHAHILKKGLLKTNIFIGNSLMSMYIRCGELTKAQQVFDELSVSNVVSWNSLISGYAQAGHGEEALRIFKRMRQDRVSPDDVTFISMLKACGSIKATEMGRKIHGEIIRGGLLLKNSLLGNAMVDMYAKCGSVSSAHQVFDELPLRNVVSFNTMISGYAQNGQIDEAIKCFERMHDEGLLRDAFTFACMLKACASCGAVKKAKEIHSAVIRQGLFHKDSVLGTALVDTYIKCGVLDKAQKVFDNLRYRDIVAWTALITGYAQYGHAEAALDVFEFMEREGLSPNPVTFSCILKSCGSIGLAEKGKEIHVIILRRGLLPKDGVLGAALVDMYIKCGRLVTAQKVFDELPYRNEISVWNSLMAGYTQSGKHVTVFDSFNKLLEEGIEPDPVTFTIMLKACSYSGLVSLGQTYFQRMSMNYGIIPTVEHQTCLVGLFCYTGFFDKTFTLMEGIPQSDCISVWYTLLGACKKWGNRKLGRVAFEHALQFDEISAVPYVYMSNICAIDDTRK